MREELNPDEQAILDNQFEHNEHLLAPTREGTRGGSVLFVAMLSVRSVYSWSIVHGLSYEKGWA
jgi:hypothetical protein